MIGDASGDVRADIGTRVVIGVGNPFRHDDGAGHAVADRVAEQLASSARGADRSTLPRVVMLDGEPSRLIDAWADAETAFVVDAMCSGAPPGSIERIEVDSTDAHADRAHLPARTSAGSTHSAGVAEAVALGRALDRMPGRLVVYAIEGADFDAGPGLSSGVEAAVSDVVLRVLEELAG